MPRDELAAKAPITWEMVLRVWGDADTDLQEDLARTGFMAIWAMLCYEWADAMIEEAGKKEG